MIFGNISGLRNVIQGNIFAEIFVYKSNCLLQIVNVRVIGCGIDSEICVIIVSEYVDQNGNNTVSRFGLVAGFLLFALLLYVIKHLSYAFGAGVVSCKHIAELLCSVNKNVHKRCGVKIVCGINKSRSKLNIKQLQFFLLAVFKNIGYAVVFIGRKQKHIPLSEVVVSGPGIINSCAR